MTDESVLSVYWLLDGSALTPSELTDVRQAQQFRWLYDHIADEQSMAAGPLLVAPCPWADELAKRWQADEARTWAVSSLHSQADFDALARHLVALRYLHTQDGQRYYLRYADSRCLVALWSVLIASQQSALLGPVLHWGYWDRQLQGQAINISHEPLATALGGAPLPMRLSDPQLGDLLQRSWPDQLLYSVGEQMPDAGIGLTLSQRYACAQRVCDWLISAQEDRYPVQVEMLKRILLSKDSVSWDKSTWAQSMRMNHEDVAYQVLLDSLS